MIHSVAVSAIAYRVADRLDYSGNDRFAVCTRPVHYAWWLFRCDRCTRALLVYGADDDAFRDAVTTYLTGCLWRCDLCMCVCPDCRDWENEAFQDY